MIQFACFSTWKDEDSLPLGSFVGRKDQGHEEMVISTGQVPSRPSAWEISTFTLPKMPQMRLPILRICLGIDAFL